MSVSETRRPCPKSKRRPAKPSPGVAERTFDVHSTENDTSCGNSPDSFCTRPACTKQGLCLHVTSLGWLGRSGGKCVKAVNVAWSYRTRPAGQLVLPHPLGRQQILQEGGVGITNLSVWKGLDTTSQWRRIALRLLPCAGGIIHAGRLRAAARSSVLRARRSGRSYIPVSPVGSARSWRRGQRCLNRDQGLAQVATDLVPLAHQAHTANW